MLKLPGLLSLVVHLVLNSCIAINDYKSMQCFFESTSRIRVNLAS